MLLEVTHDVLKHNHGVVYRCLIRTPYRADACDYLPRRECFVHSISRMLYGFETLRGQWEEESTFNPSIVLVVFEVSRLAS